MRLETEQGHYVADVEPVIAAPPGALPDVVALWGARLFVKATDKRIGRNGDVWRETLPLLVHTRRGEMPWADGLDELGHIAYDAHRVCSDDGKRRPEWLQLEPKQREAWRAAADAVAMLLHLQRPDNPAHPVRSEAGWRERHGVVEDAARTQELDSSNDQT